jgi:hypothetical protein
MKVKTLGQISGTRDGKEWPPSGSVLDLPEGEARDLVKSGMAVETDDDVSHADFIGAEVPAKKAAKGDTETASATPQENAATRSGGAAK